MDKRALALQARRALSMEEVTEKSAAILHQLQPYLHGRVAIYLACDHEVDLNGLLPQRELSFCIPIAFSDRSMKFYAYDYTTKLMKSSFGILEPVDAEEIPVEEITVMVIPVVAFDEARHRLGHGAGYYDRYLAGFHGTKLGVAFACQRMEALQVMPHDIAMDHIITEDAVY